MGLRIKKTLTANDTGENGSHQAGLLVPKNQDFLNFFPELNSNKLNPFVWVSMFDEFDKEWKFKFIHYNNKLVSEGTRNEYRLTCMTQFFREHKINVGSILIFEKISKKYLVRVEISSLKIENSKIWEVEFL